jgi:hypothetical protein
MVPGSSPGGPRFFTFARQCGEFAALSFYFIKTTLKLGKHGTVIYNKGNTV